MIHVLSVDNNEVTVSREGELVLIDTVYEKLIGDVITFKGEPFGQTIGLSHLVRKIKLNTNWTIQCKTGYDFEYLMSNLRYELLLRELDILIENQRIIDVQKSLIEGNVVLYEGD